jgi:type I restriction enzyme, S subunit
MTTYASYKRYKSDWLPELPAHWGRRRIKFLTSFMVSGGTPTTGTDIYWGGDIPWVSPKDMKAAVVTVTEDYITQEGVSASAARLVPPGTLLMVVRSGILRHSIPVALSSREVAINQDIKAVGFLPNIDPAYVRYFIDGLQAELLTRWRKTGTTVESIESDYFANDDVPVPPLPEQVGIVEFLDRETALIDALIDKKRRLLDLLEEKRLAVITHAVTKSLVPDAPMKDSGIDWLGQIPAHWETTTPIKYLVRSIGGCTPSTTNALYWDEDIPWVSPN